jgi:peptidoglycan L-alanyl-D-glutamate endopeptidase CwlK
MRDITKCHPTLQKKAKELVKRCDKAGLKIQITECVRTVAEQNELYAKGRTKHMKSNLRPRDRM